MSAAEVLARALETRWGTTAQYAERILEKLHDAGYTVISFDELSATESRLLAASLMAAANSVEVSDD